MNGLVVEFHYKDGDVGAYQATSPGMDELTSALWAMFAEGAVSSHIVIRRHIREQEGVS